jgi:hypothetical protein
MNKPLSTIFKHNDLKITKFSNLTKQSSFLNDIQNESDMKNLLKRSHYDTVFSEIMHYFNKSTFYNKVFLPRMDKRTKFMRMNRKFTPLTQEQFDEQKEKLQINNTYDKYSFRQEIPLFTYITNDPDQFENWSAIRIFEWWRSLRMSVIPKEEWPIFDAVKYLFINQFMRIMNSYLKYGIDIEDTTHAFDNLQEYLRLVDEFYKRDGQYKYLLNAHLAFCEWFSERFIGGLLFESGQSNDKKYVKSSMYYNIKKEKDEYKQLIKDYFSLTCKNNNSILVIPLSFFQKESKFINIYTGPFIVFLGVNYRTHYLNNDFYKLYSPYGQIFHDFKFHAETIILSYNELYRIHELNKPTNLLQKDDILLFEERCKFLTIVSLTENNEFKKLLWYILHEDPIYFFTSANSFFNINILFINLNEIIDIQNKNISSLYKKYSIESLCTLICVCIVFFMSNFLSLEYFQNLKIIVESIIFMNNPNNISNKIIKILRDDNILIEFKYNIQTKQFELLYLSDYKLLKGILNLQSKRISLIHNTSCFESYLLSPNTIQACEILSGYRFFNNVFLPKMRDRVAKKRVIMRVNNKKFSKLSEANFQKKQTELGMKTNSFNKYQERYDTPLFTYITNDPDQFENWSAIRIFEWWCNLRMSGTQLSTFQTIIPKRKWPIFDAVKYLFINQILHILNSYRKYGISDGSHWAFNRLHEYLQLVDSFYNSQGQYQYLLNAHLAFCDWFSVRFIGGLLFERRKGNYVNSREYKNYSENIILLQESATNKLKKIFEKSLIDKNYILFIPLSISQKESKFINIYSSPIISYLGTNYRTHENCTMYYLHYSPIHQITHDIYIHAKQIIENYSSLYPTENYNDVALFAKRCKFLTIVSFIENAIILLFNILHETYFFKESSNNFFDLNILFNKLNDNKKIYDTILRRVNKSILDNGIYTLICACIIFFMCNFLLLNDIQKIAITINDLITTVSFNEEQLIQLQINTKDKKIVLLYVKPEIDKRYIQSLNFNVNRLGYRIVDSEQNKINKLSSNIGNLLAKLNEQNKTTLMN